MKYMHCIRGEDFFAGFEWEDIIVNKCSTVPRTNRETQVTAVRIMEMQWIMDCYHNIHSFYSFVGIVRSVFVLCHPYTRLGVYIMCPWVWRFLDSVRCTEMAQQHKNSTKCWQRANVMITSLPYRWLISLYNFPFTENHKDSPPVLPTAINHQRSSFYRFYDFISNSFSITSYNTKHTHNRYTHINFCVHAIVMDSVGRRNKIK